MRRHIRGPVARTSARISWPGAGGPTHALLGLALAATTFVAACGSAASPTPRPTPTPTPTPTPNPHLTEPASVDAVFRALNGAGLRIVANTASAGVNGDPRKIINATYAGWPLLLSEYRSHASLVAATRFDPKDSNRIGDPPFSIVGLNILIQYGPNTGRSAIDPPDPAFVAAAQRIVTVLDPLLGPLQQRSVVPLLLPGASPAPTGSPSASGSPKASPRASPKSTAKPSPRPSG